MNPRHEFQRADSGDWPECEVCGLGFTAEVHRPQERPANAVSRPVSASQAPEESLVRAPGLKPGFEGYGWEQFECDAWEGRPSEYQGEAKDVLRDQLGSGYEVPWVYVTPICHTKMCMQQQHLKFFRARKIHYPAGVCVYCGLPGFTRDHLLPATLTGDAVRKFVAVVPACLECNSGLGDRCGYTITERREDAHLRIRKKHRRALNLKKAWPPNELAELGPNLRRHIQNGLIKREIQLQRLAWPWDPEYDKRAFQKSGFDDPIEMGLI